MENSEKYNKLYDKIYALFYQQENLYNKEELDNELPVDYMFMSSVAQQGLQELKDKLWQMLNAKPADE